MFDRISEYKAKSEAISIDDLSYVSNFGSVVDKKTKFTNIFKITKEDRRVLVKDIDSQCSKVLSQDGIRRDVTNKKILRTIRRFYKNIVSLKVGRMNIVTRNPSKFLHDLKRKILLNPSLETLFQGELKMGSSPTFGRNTNSSKLIRGVYKDDYLGSRSSVESNRTSDSVSTSPQIRETILEILLWFALPKCYHNT
jgi:hypothetical protein